ncbi:aldehyde dehydrogenase family protein, partial [Vibrio parahaemolyticus V-223/04]
SSQGALWSL